MPLSRNRQVEMRIKYPEIDYQGLMHILADLYGQPRRKIQEMQKNGTILRVKKGLYVVHPDFSREVYRHEIVANLLYGPSYLSLESALSFHGLIPERVETYTSVTPARARRFNTPIGPFSYDHLSPLLYPLGVELQEISGKRHYMIACPEKAVLDYLLIRTRDEEFKRPSDVPDFLARHLRCDPAGLRTLDRGRLQSWLPAYRRRRRARWFIAEMGKETR